MQTLTTAITTYSKDKLSFYVRINPLVLSNHGKNVVLVHGDLNVSSSHKIVENFANYFLNTKAKSDCFTVYNTVNPSYINT